MTSGPSSPRWLNGVSKLLEVTIALALLLMVIMVFGNVVLRYAFNSGITVSEELSRWLFVWMTFLGAVVALKDHAHLGSDMLVSRLPTGGKKALLVIGHVMMLYFTWLIFSGSLQQARINLDVEAPVTGAPMAILYGAGVAFSVLAGIFLVYELWLALSGKLRDEDLVMVKESEEAGELEALQAELERDHADTPAHMQVPGGKQP